MTATLQPINATPYEDGDYGQMFANLDAGHVVEISAETFDYFLEVLPPCWMNKIVDLPGYGPRLCSFGQAEGYEPVNAFWSDRQTGTRRYFAMRTAQMNPNA